DSSPGRSSSLGTWRAFYDPRLKRLCLEARLDADRRSVLTVARAVVEQQRAVVAQVQHERTDVEAQREIERRPDAVAELHAEAGAELELRCEEAARCEGRVERALHAAAVDRP